MSTSGAPGLLVGLVRAPSVSGNEGVVAGVLAGWAGKRGIPVTADDAAVKLTIEGRGPGPTLLLASHLDTVPPGEGWNVDPHAGVIEAGWLHARGAVDAKASVAAMACAAAALHAEGGPARGRLVVLATFGEETRETSMPVAIERLGLPDAALVGEPTSLEPCTAQRGLLVLRMLWHGDQRHAGRADEKGAGPNSINLAARDLITLSQLDLGRVHPTLGRISITPVSIGAGVAGNVTPPHCEARFDVRTTPAFTQAEVAAAIDAATDGDVEVISDRFHPTETPPGSRLLAAINRIRPGVVPFASPTSSDWVFLRETDTVKIGPGDSRLSHTPRERIEFLEVEAAARLYADVAREYLR